MVTHLAFIIKNGEKQKTPALNNKKRGKAKSTQKKQKHTYLIDGRTYISNSFALISTQSIHQSVGLSARLSGRGLDASVHLSEMIWKKVEI